MITVIQPLSKAAFKAKALEYLRQVEETGEELIITDHGRPAVRIIPYRADEALTETQAAWGRRLGEGSVRYDAATATEPLPPSAWGELT